MGAGILQGAFLRQFRQVVLQEVQELVEVEETSVDLPHARNAQDHADHGVHQLIHLLRSQERIDFLHVVDHHRREQHRYQVVKREEGLALGKAVKHEYTALQLVGAALLQLIAEMNRVAPRYNHVTRAFNKIRVVVLGADEVRLNVLEQSTRSLKLLGANATIFSYDYLHEIGFCEPLECGLGRAVDPFGKLHHLVFQSPLELSRNLRARLWMMRDAMRRHRRQIRRHDSHFELRSSLRHQQRVESDDVLERLSGQRAQQLHIHCQGW
mmetsp:Transcript_28857/g.48962  ORF Transcript_28857/g.48962 Transcript_28857/m.48962 type:complete len:268 (+) Transcript_28857:5570-6373(+)